MIKFNSTNETFPLTVNVERISDSEFGFTVIMVTKDGTRIMNNVSEVHANHDGNGDIAIESDYHSMGNNMNIAAHGIKFVSVYDATSHHDDMDARYDASDKVKDKIPALKTLLSLSPQWAKKGLLAIYACQTDDEQSSGTTSHDNGEGFTGVDAEILSSFAKQIIAGRFAGSPKQMKILHSKMPKYAGQLDRIAKSKQAEPKPITIMRECNERMSA